MSSEDDGSGGEGHSGSDSADEVLVYNGVGVGGDLDDLDDTPQEVETHRQRYQAQLRAFNAKRANWQGSVVETASGGVSGAPSGGGEIDSSSRSSNGGDGSGVSDSTNTLWEAGTSPRQHHHLRKTAKRAPAAVGKASPRHPTVNSRQIAEKELPSRYFPGDQAQPGVDRRIARVDCKEDAREIESRRAAGHTGIGAGGDVSVQRGQRTIPRGV